MNINWEVEHVILIYSLVQSKWWVIVCKVKNDSYSVLIYLLCLKTLFFLGWEWKRKAAKGTRIIIDFTKNSGGVICKNYKLQLLQKILQMSVFTQEYKASPNETNTNGGLD